MKIIVLHGDDTQKSYKRLNVFINEAKKRNWKITDFKMEEIENQNLFAEECFYILNDYKLIDKKLIEKLKKYSGNLIIYQSAKIPAVALKNLNADKTELFELPQLLWKFLDNMTITGFHDLLKTQPAEYILAMMAWKLKQKYMRNPTIETGLFISKLAEIDVKVKTGRLNLIQALDLLLIKKIS